MLDFYKWEEHIAAQVLERVKVVEGHTSKMFWVPGARIDGVEVAHHVEDRLELKERESDLLTFLAWLVCWLLLAYRIDVDFDFICHHIELSLCLITALLLRICVLYSDEYHEILPTINHVLLGHDFRASHGLLLFNLIHQLLVELADILWRVKPMMLSQEKQGLLLESIPLECGILLILEVVDEELVPYWIVLKRIEVLQQMFQSHDKELLFLFFVLEQASMLPD
jgi:hypothetical protein